MRQPRKPTVDVMPIDWYFSRNSGAIWQAAWMPCGAKSCRAPGGSNSTDR